MSKEQGHKAPPWPLQNCSFSSTKHKKTTLSCYACKLEARVKYLREENHVGVQWIQRHYGSECTDDCPLEFEEDDDALEELNDVFAAKTNRQSRRRAMRRH